ncbi:hypothetical protein BACCELL_02151 [Bacteroides cellulosilyticus DSM 14838]|uniref:Uncharacterized protein n=1 Tax=Bacteroides cellulosilyticus DSM 14838 TaxID=537012 RepID=E2NCZ3_9BACE|nr:hypothetical protein BACCELL_02151 [Bacteroides cellulosilyticus DSM 14838]
MRFSFIISYRYNGSLTIIIHTFHSFQLFKINIKRKAIHSLILNRQGNC